MRSKLRMNWWSEICAKTLFNLLNDFLRKKKGFFLFEWSFPWQNIGFKLLLTFNKYLKLKLKKLKCYKQENKFKCNHLIWTTTSSAIFLSWFVILSKSSILSASSLALMCRLMMVSPSFVTHQQCFLVISKTDGLFNIFCHFSRKYLIFVINKLFFILKCRFLNKIMCF